MRHGDGDFTEEVISHTSGCTLLAYAKVLLNQLAFSNWLFILCPVRNSLAFHSLTMP